jgi:regulator of protease activity HflC (stomatin/prohibitin superfamily)
MEYLVLIVGVIAVIIFLQGIRIVRPTNRGLIERLGKYHRFAMPGFHWIIPAIDFATAQETMADGSRRAEIKKADGVKQARILEAEGEAQAIKLVNEAANEYFIGNAQLLKRLETVERALANNAKVVLPANVELINVIGELAGGILPVPKK